jgi:hypothetical protein
MLTPTLDAAQVRAVIKELRNIDPTIVKDLRADLRSQLSPIAQQVAANVPTEPILSGFGRGGATRWAAVKGKTSFTPGKSRTGAKSLVSIRVEPRDGLRGVYIAELAGSRSGGKTPQGNNLIAVLNQRAPMKGRGGRFMYSQFRMLRPDVIKIAERILNKTFAKIERSLT